MAIKVSTAFYRQFKHHLTGFIFFVVYLLYEKKVARARFCFDDNCHACHAQLPGLALLYRN